MGILVRFAVLLVVSVVPCAAMAAWEPEKAVELVVPAKAGSRLDQMARLIQDIAGKHKLMPQALIVINKSGGDGVEGFLLIARGNADPYQIMIASNNLFTVPLATGVPFNWKDTSPIAMLALEPFILWTHPKSGYKSAMDYIDAAKVAGARKMKMRGVGVRQEGQFLTTIIEKTSFVKFAYLPAKGELKTGAEQEDFDSALYKPMEAAAFWRAGVLTPQCVFNDVRMPYPAKVTELRSWSDIPSCKEAGLYVSYQSLWGVFMQPGVTEEQINYFRTLFIKVVDTPEWRAHMEQGAYNQTFMTGPAFTAWLSGMEATHKQLLGGCSLVCK